MVSGYLSKRLLKLLLKMIQREKTNLLRQCVTASTAGNDDERAASLDESVACTPPVDLVERMSTMLEESEPENGGRVDSDVIMRCWLDGLSEAGLVDGAPRRQRRNRSPMKPRSTRKDDVRTTLFSEEDEEKEAGDGRSGDRAIDDIWLEIASLVRPMLYVNFQVFFFYFFKKVFISLRM